MKTCLVCTCFVVTAVAIGASLIISTMAGVCSDEESSEKMVAAFYTEHGPASVLKVASIPAPLRKPGQVLIEVHAVAANPVDFKFRAKPVPTAVLPLPKIVGSDLAGMVLEADASSPFKAGDRVYAMLPTIGCRWGSHAQIAAVDARHVAIMPHNLNFSEAASLPLVALTAVQAFDEVTCSRRREKGGCTGKSVLVQAGSGGVGTFAIQYARYLGFDVYTTSSNEEMCKELGAKRVINYRKEKFEDIGVAYDVVFELMGGDIERRGLAAMNPEGHFLAILNSGWDEEVGESLGFVVQVLRAMYFPLLHLLSPGSNPSYSLIGVKCSGEVLQFISGLAEAGEVRSVLHSIVPLEEVQDVHRILEGGRAKGKLVMTTR